MSISKKQIALVVAGNAFEWLDFVVYASLSSVLTKLFFPNTDFNSGLLMTLAIFSMSFLARPIGGLIFGHLGDAYGRRLALYTSGGVLAFTSIAIALMPTYETLGVAAPIILLLVRVIQSIAIGGEYPALVTYLIESSPANKRGFYGTFAQISTTGGVLLATLVMMGLNSWLTSEQILSWGWRLPFGIGFITLLICLYYRFKLLETPEFQAARQKLTHFKKAPVKEAFTQHYRTILFIFIMIMAPAVVFYTYNISGQMLVKRLPVSDEVKLWLPVFNAILLTGLMPVCGLLIDRLGWQKVMGSGFILAIIAGTPIYYIMQQPSLVALLSAQLLWAVIAALILSCVPISLVDSTEVSTRTTVLAISYNLCLVLFGGFTPTINLMLNSYNPVMPGVYVSVVSLISLLCITRFSPQTYTQQLQRA
ncbi:MFS transporter [Zooshikella marina]|uniref:MFS transporter n=1 Tax=Zooshikella ganghwensis TaxID=202772 RepID=A0A4P9VVS7_9GAMM|nr:MFS transporter [Zooshikella ganghwensis]MBU2705899.1 MFS transporter [Zooshikella ganghwensis]RDH46494.1 MFS transporter [Zooshikella ganghwensis]